MATPVREIDHDRPQVEHREDPRYATPAGDRVGRGYHGLYDSPRLGSQRVAGENRYGGPAARSYRPINNSQRNNRSRSR